MKFLILFYLLIYVYFVAKNFFLLCKIRKAITVLNNYLNSAIMPKSYYDEIIKKDNYQQCLNDVLFYYPTIAEFKDSFECLEYGVPDKQNLVAAYHLCNELMMKRNFIFQSFTESLNPVNVLKQIFKFPSSFIAWIGFNPSSMFSKLFNIFCWALTFALNMYSEEIKSFISTLIHK